MNMKTETFDSVTGKATPFGQDFQSSNDTQGFFYESYTTSKQVVDSKVCTKAYVGGAWKMATAELKNAS